MRPRVLLSLLPGLLLCCGACLTPRTPAAACERLVAGVREGDSAQVFDALLENTRWSLYTVAKEHGEMRRLIESEYPKAAQAAALSRLQPASSDGKDLFRRLYRSRVAADLSRRVGPGAPVIETPPGTAPDHAYCRLPGKEPLRFARSPSGRWGFAELDAEWDQAKLRAVHDLDTVRENVRLYRQAPPASAGAPP